MSEEYELTGNLSNHCACNNCRWCRTRREAVMAEIRKVPAPPPGTAWDRPIGYRDAPQVPWSMGSADSAPRVMQWTMKDPRGRTKGHRLVRFGPLKGE